MANIVFLQLLCFPVALFAESEASTSLNPEPRILYITLDGVRTEEFFLGAYPYRRKRSYRDRREYLWPYVWRDLARRPGSITMGNIYRRQRACRINNRSGISLPAYADIFAARDQNQVKSNQFKRQLNHPTMLDRLLKEGLPANQIAIFASWQPIRRIVSINQNPGFIIDTGRKPGNARPRWHNARYDYDTYLSTMRFLNRNQDFRFLFIGFNDTDEWGHLDNYHRYLRGIRRQDTYLRNFMKSLEPSSNLNDDRTILILTTDHSRGRGRYWPRHSARLRGPSNIWSLIHIPPEIQKARPDLKERIKKLYGDCSHVSLSQLAEASLRRQSEDN